MVLLEVVGLELAQTHGTFVAFFLVPVFPPLHLPLLTLEALGPPLAMGEARREVLALRRGGRVGGVDVGKLEVVVGDEWRVGVGVYVEPPGGLVVVRVLVGQGLAHRQVRGAEAGHRERPVVQARRGVCGERVAQRRGPGHTPVLLQGGHSSQRGAYGALGERAVVLCDVCEAPRHGLCGDLRNTDRQGATVAAQLLDGLGGVVQRGLDVGSGHQVLGSAEHLQHVRLSVIGGQVRLGQTRRPARILHSIETAVNTLRGGRELEIMRERKDKMFGGKQRGGEADLSNHL